MFSWRRNKKKHTHTLLCGTWLSVVIFTRFLFERKLIIGIFRYLRFMFYMHAFIPPHAPHSTPHTPRPTLHAPHSTPHTPHPTPLHPRLYTRSASRISFLHTPSLIDLYHVCRVFFKPAYVYLISIGPILSTHRRSSHPHVPLTQTSLSPTRSNHPPFF